MLLALSSQVLGWLLISVSLPRLPAVLTSIVLMLQPVSTVFLGAMLLSESPSAVQLLGVAIVIAGVAVATVRPRRAAHHRRGLESRLGPGRWRLDSPRVALIRRLFEHMEKNELASAAEELLAHSADGRGVRAACRPRPGDPRARALRDFWWVRGGGHSAACGCLLDHRGGRLASS